MKATERAAVFAGLLGPLVGLAATLAATTLSPTFRWRGSALSDLGAPGAVNPWLFNVGLEVAAVLTVVFAWVVWAGADHPFQRVGAATFAASMVALGLVGAFPTGTDVHFPAALAYFVLLTFVLWIHGTGTALAGAVGRGLVSMWLGIGHVLLWLGWVGAGLGGIAIQELGGTLLLYAWILLEARPGETRTNWLPGVSP